MADADAGRRRPAQETRRSASASRDLTGRLRIRTPQAAKIALVSAGAADRHQITRAKHLLSSVEASVMGCILNHVTHDGQSYYYYHNSYKSYRSRS